MAAPYYKPVKKNRFFRNEKRYSDIDWNDWSQVISEFQGRIQVWYIDPIQHLQTLHGDYSFSVAGLTCVLIDMLSQYHPQPPRPPRAPSGFEFKAFVRTYLPRFAGPLPVPVTHHRHDTGSTYRLTALEEVIYHAIRCGILHEAHVTLYAGIYGLNGKPVKYYKAKCTKYANGRKCLTIAIDPHLLFNDTYSAFHQFIANLGNSDPRFDPWRLRFKEKFLAAFGITIGAEPV